MRYRFYLECPVCGQITEDERESDESVRLRCEDCFVEREEVVEMIVVEIEEVSP